MADGQRCATCGTTIPAEPPYQVLPPPHAEQHAALLHETAERGVLTPTQLWFSPVDGKLSTPVTPRFLALVGVRPLIGSSSPGWSKIPSFFDSVLVRRAARKLKDATERWAEYARSQGLLRSLTTRGLPLRTVAILGRYMLAGTVTVMRTRELAIRAARGATMRSLINASGASGERGARGARALRRIAAVVAESQEARCVSLPPLSRSSR